MPELPEVEFVARQLRDDLVGWRIRRAEVFWPRAIQGLGVPEFEAGLAGAKAEALAASSSWIQTANEIKGLQLDWKTIGVVTRGQERMIWERFLAFVGRWIPSAKILHPHPNVRFDAMHPR